jgi:hypothetical protein
LETDSCGSPSGGAGEYAKVSETSVRALMLARALIHERPPVTGTMRERMMRLLYEVYHGVDDRETPLEGPAPELQPAAPALDDELPGAVNLFPGARTRIPYDRALSWRESQSFFARQRVHDDVGVYGRWDLRRSEESDEGAPDDDGRIGEEGQPKRTEKQGKPSDTQTSIPEDRPPGQADPWSGPAGGDVH